MSGIFKKLADVKAAVVPVQAAKLYRTDIVGTEEFVVSESIDTGNLQRLLECLMHEDCVHSWRNFSSEETLDGLLRWENELRPTRIFFFYLERGGERRMVAAGAVAARLTRDFPHPGFCVLGRCYIMPQFRGQGFYRQILRYRMEYCRAQFNGALKAIHIGSVNERISQVITNHRFAGWPGYIHLGEEELSVAGQIQTVGAYLLLLPEYVRKIQSALSGTHAPACVVKLRNTLSRIESCDIRNLGTLVKETFEEASASGWFDERDAHEIEQLLLFCSSIPLVGFK
jgi:GNAT superfamily N-acetyltransferase